MVNNAMLISEMQDLLLVLTCLNAHTHTYL